MRSAGETASALERDSDVRVRSRPSLHLTAPVQPSWTSPDLRSLRDGDHVTVLAGSPPFTRPMRNRRDAHRSRREWRLEPGLDVLPPPVWGKIKTGAVGLFAGKVSCVPGNHRLTHPRCTCSAEWSRSRNRGVLCQRIIPCIRQLGRCRRGQRQQAIDCYQSRSLGLPT